MRLYLVQHGDALAKEVDAERPLSSRGRADVERVASVLGKAAVRVPRILHSGKKRAEQTAELLASRIATRESLKKAEGINPLDPTEAFAQVISKWSEDTMAVGHLPFMGKLVSRLVADDEDATTVVFVPGTVVCLERTE
jgi:phosphohistidine phosphatase